MRTAEWTTSVTVLDRVTAVLEAFGEDDEGLGVSELARRANLPKSTVSRVAAELVAQQYLDRVGDRFHIGMRLFELGRTVERPRMLRQRALPVMAHLRALTGASVLLGILDGADVVVLAVTRAQPAAVAVPRVGARLPAHATALGKALLAFAPPGAADDAVLERELAEIRRNGVATDRGERPATGFCLAGAVIDAGGAACASIGVVGQADQLDTAPITAAVRASAMTLSRRGGSARVS
ncbi:IclR family transcriptional regulator [Microbacterium sp. P04]|uniref:IclR family transcriptional regulator n=1 Tax=Microbacterium sp. P04 TaxID=3366947 RepID=UPI00374757B1